MTKKIRILVIIALILAFFLGIGIMFYPLISTRYMDTVRSEIHTQYQQELTARPDQELDLILQNARDFNVRLFQDPSFRLQSEENGYYQQMLVPGIPDIMGYITIPRLNINLPILHGVDTDALSSGCGHMPQTSLPVGGSSTHAVLSAHTGMANAKMFSDLPLLRPGDLWQIETLGQILTYEIQSDADIQTVLPHQVQTIHIQEGDDLCTLVTCVPFGVNTHRLLVTGHRIPTPTDDETPDGQMPIIQVHHPESVWELEYRHSFLLGIKIVGIVFLIAIITYFLIIKIRKYRNRNRHV